MNRDIFVKLLEAAVQSGKKYSGRDERSGHSPASLRAG